MTLSTINATVAAASAHGLRMLVNLVIVKLISVSVGTTGLGLLGNFMSLTTLVSVFAGGGIANGITKYVAEYSSKPNRLISFLGAATLYGCVFSAIFLLFTVVFHSQISLLVFNTVNYEWLIPCFGVAQFLTFLGTGVVAVINGQRRSDLFAKITISAYLCVLPLVFLLVTYFGIYGAAISLMLSISCTAFPSLYLIIRHNRRLVKTIKLRASLSDIRKLSSFTLMLVASAVLFPTSEIFIRSQIIQHLGYEQAGIWQGLNRLSGAYLGFFTVFLSTHYMPKLSNLLSSKDLMKEVKENLVLSSIAFAIFAVLIYFFRGFVINLLFSESFSPMKDFIHLQLLGDFFRLLSYVIGFLAVAKAAIVIYISAEIIQSALYSGLVWFNLSHNGNMETVVQSYTLTYFSYFIVSSIVLMVFARRGK
jgi:O-antigen/teichoic acid export membrane protein